MSPYALGIIIGGLIPALCFGLANLSVKGASQAGIGMGSFVLFVGLGVLLSGAVFFLLIPDKSISLSSGMISVGMGAAWGTGIGIVFYALNRFDIPIGVLTPLFNMNTLVTVLLALWIFAEWKQVRVPQLLF